MYEPPARVKPAVNLQSFQEYEEMYKESVDNPQGFWKKHAKSLLTWYEPFTEVLSGEMSAGDVKWFSDGVLNVCYNCVDRHAKTNPEKVAIVAEGDEPGNSRKVTYGELQEQVCRFSNLLLSHGVQKGDVVAIYMPMIPEAAYAMLSCARIGAVHSVVFAGFSSEALRDRIIDAQCKVLITADQGKRGGKVIQLKRIANEAVDSCPSIEKVIVFQHTGDNNIPMDFARDVVWNDEILKQSEICPAIPLNAEDPLFILYTSGSTGKPKGLLHTQAGYLLGALMTLKYTFDMDSSHVFGCVADVGWITGHSYIVYGPLGNGMTSVFFESVPTYPDPGRYWKMVDQHKITHFYTAPTAIRALKRHGDAFVKPYKLDSLKVLGTVGEPINPEAWKWYYETVGRGKCAIVDTYWQTETGSFIVAPYASVTPTKPGSCTLPQFGIQIALLDAHTGKPVTDPGVDGVMCVKHPWPSMARTIFNGKERYLNTYFSAYPGHYFTGDGGQIDEDGYYWIQGRVDDVINVSGHRMSTAEIESALIHHAAIAESAVVGAPDEICGQSIAVFCVLKGGHETADRADMKKQLTEQVRKSIGPFATPKWIYIVPDLPKTRSGKIMRRILRKIVYGEADQLGDLSTLADPASVQKIMEVFEKNHQ